MRKSALLVTAVCLFIFAGSYFLYITITSRKSLQPWDLVPRDALLVFEGDVNKIGDKDFFEMILPNQGKDTTTDIFLIRKVLTRKTNLISLHVTQREGFNLAVYSPITGKEQKELEKLFAGTKNGKTKFRNFEGSIITECPITRTKAVIVTLIDHILVISNAPILVEDVIRESQSDKSAGFRSENAALFSLARIESDNGNVYVDLKQVAKLQKLFTSPKQRGVIDYFGNSMLIDLKIKDQLMLMNGFALDSLKSGTSFLSLFNDQRPVPLDLKSIIPSGSAWVAHFGISDFQSWTKSRIKFCEQYNKALIDSLKIIDKHGGFSYLQLNKLIGDEIAEFSLDRMANHLFAIKLKDRKGVISFLNKIKQKSTRDSSYSENYAGCVIRRSKLPGLAYTLFWPLTQQTSFDFYTVYDDYLVFSSEIDELKLLLDNIDAETTWTKSTEWNKFLESTAQETNVSFFFNETLIPELKNDLTKPWIAFADSLNLFAFKRGALQFSRLDDNYYFNGTLTLSVNNRSISVPSQHTEKQLVWEQPLRYGFHQVKNHTDGTVELLFQDSENQLVLMSSDMKVYWKKSIEKPIIGPVTQIDYFKNKKLQYFFVTTSHLHVVDRLGKYVSGFPKKVDDTSAALFSAVLDYDNSKNYRFVIGQANGNLFMHDKQGTALEGWRPNKLKGSILLSLQHFKIDGKDYLLSVDETGKVYILNRKGDLRSKPVDLNSIGHSGFLYKQKSKSDDLQLVTSDGRLVQLDVSGKIVDIQALPKSSTDSKFRLVTDAGNTTAWVSRVDKVNAAVLDLSGNLVFEKENPGSEKISLTCFDFGQNVRVFCFWDAQQEFAYLYDQNGMMISGKPFESSLPPAVIRGENGQISIITSYRNQISKHSF